MTNYFDSGSQSSNFEKKLRLSSNSQEVANQRRYVYEQAANNLETLREINKQVGFFSNTDIAPSKMGVTLAEASLDGYADSIVGFIAIERPMTQMRESLVYTDLVTKSGAKIISQFGKDTPRDRAQKSVKVVMTDASETISLGSPIAPGTVRLTAVVSGVTHEITDDKKGNLLAAGGLLAETAKVDYTAGTIQLDFSDAAATPTISGTADLDGTEGNVNNRARAKQGYFDIHAGINKFEYEVDLISAMVSQKTVGSDVVAKVKQFVKEEQTIAINNNLVNAIKDNYTGRTLTIDLTRFTIASGQMESVFKMFVSGITSVEGALAAKTYRAVSPNAYVVGPQLADLFNSLDEATGWVPNHTGYVNGLIGFYKGRAIIRNLELDAFEGFAVYKSPDGNMAPAAFGTLLPATDLPLVGNFNNTNEVASGIYSVDGVASLTSELAQRFEVKMPIDWMVLA